MLNKRSLLLFFFIFLQSCQAANEAMIGGKRSEKSDEFLIQKKNPLSMPPDFNELPEPANKTSQKNISQPNEIKEKLKIKTTVDNKTSDGSKRSLDKIILEKIN